MLQVQFYTKIMKLKANKPRITFSRKKATSKTKNGKWVAKSKFPEYNEHGHRSTYASATIVGEGTTPEFAYNSWYRMYIWTAQGRPTYGRPRR